MLLILKHISVDLAMWIFFTQSRTFLKQGRQSMCDVEMEPLCGNWAWINTAGSIYTADLISTSSSISTSQQAQFNHLGSISTSLTLISTTFFCFVLNSSDELKRFTCMPVYGKESRLIILIHPQKAIIITIKWYAWNY